MRDAAFAFDLPALPANELEVMNKLTRDLYAGDDAVFDRENVLFWPYDEAEQTQRREVKKKRRAERKEFLEAVFGRAKKLGGAAKAATSVEGGTKDTAARDKLSAEDDASEGVEDEESEQNEEEESEQNEAAGGEEWMPVDIKTLASPGKDEQTERAMAERPEASETAGESSAEGQTETTFIPEDGLGASLNSSPPDGGKGDGGENEDPPRSDGVGSVRKTTDGNGGEGVTEKREWPDDVF